MIRLKEVSNLRFLPLTEMSIEGISYASPRKLIGQAQTGVINNRYHPPQKQIFFSKYHILLPTFSSPTFIKAIYARVPLVVIVCFTRFTKVITNKTRNQIVWKRSFHLIQIQLTQK